MRKIPEEGADLLSWREKAIPAALPY